MKLLNLSAEDICNLGRLKGLKEICNWTINCEDTQEKARRDYKIAITGIDGALKKKTFLFTITEWEEIVHDDK